MQTINWLILYYHENILCFYHILIVAAIKLYNLLTALSPKASKTKPADDDELSIDYFNYFVICLYKYKIN